MDHILLGLLILKSRTIYEFRCCIEAGLNLMYSCSTGSIQAALKKLQEQGFITAEAVLEGKRNKKVYSITDSGREFFGSWVNDPMKAMGEKHPELAKLYFMGFAAPDGRSANIRHLLEELKQAHSQLSLICTQGEAMEVPGEAEDILFHQLASARFGRDLMAFQIQWYEKFLKEEEGRENRE